MFHCYDACVSETPPAPLSGRRRQAARNDELILAAAREVFLADPGAPISEVANHAGVGISALYTRYASKDELLRKLCRDGLQIVVDATEEALADGRDDWLVFGEYMQALVDADTSSLTLSLAGRFTPTEDMFALAERANELFDRFFARIAHELRPGLEPHDISLVFEFLAAIRVADRPRTELLRRRYLAVVLDGLRTHGDELPGPGPSWREVTERWEA